MVSSVMIRASIRVAETLTHTEGLPSESHRNSLMQIPLEMASMLYLSFTLSFSFSLFLFFLSLSVCLSQTHTHTLGFFLTGKQHEVGSCCQCPSCTKSREEA